MNFLRLSKDFPYLINTWLSRIDLNHFQYLSHLLCSTLNIFYRDFNSPVAYLEIANFRKGAGTVRIYANIMLAYLSSDPINIDYAEFQTKFTIAFKTHCAQLIGEKQRLKCTIAFAQAIWNSLNFAAQNNFLEVMENIDSHKDKFNIQMMIRTIVYDYYNDPNSSCVNNITNFFPMFQKWVQSHNITDYTSNTLTPLLNTTIANVSCTLFNQTNNNTAIGIHERSSLETPFYLLTMTILIMLIFGSLLYCHCNRRTKNNSGVKSSDLPYEILHLSLLHHTPEEPLSSLESEPLLI